MSAEAFPDNADIPPNIQQIGDPAAQWWVVRQRVEPILGKDTGNSHQVSRLYENILSSVGLDSGMVFTIDLSLTGDSIQDKPIVDNLNVDLATLLAAYSPKVFLILGERSAQGILNTDQTLDMLRQQNCHANYPIGMIVASHDLESLLKQPSKKAELWQDICRVKTQIMDARS